MPITYSDTDRTRKVRNRLPAAFTFLLLLAICSSCKRDLYEGHPATLQVFNAMEEGVQLYSNLSGRHPIQYSASLIIRNKQYDLRNNMIYVNNFPQLIDLYAMPDTMPHDKPVISANVSLKEGEIYSLFIYGEKATAAYSLFADRIPNINRNDSTTHLRFANFSTAQAININLKGQPTGSFVQNLAFKSLSDFVELKADKATANYEFEIRDQATGNLLSTYITSGLNTGGGQSFEANKWIFKSNTLVFTGRPGAPAPNDQKIIMMNHR